MLKYILGAMALILVAACLTGCGNPQAGVTGRVVQGTETPQQIAQAKGETRYTIKYTAIDGNVRTVNANDCWYSDGYVSYRDIETSHTIIILTGNSRAEITRRW